MAEPNHTTEPLTLEAAIERTGRPLRPLFEAAAAWRAAPPILILDDRIGGALRPRATYERELAAVSEHFVQLVAAGAWTIQVRPWNQLGGPLSPVRPGEASQLSIEVDPSGKSLTLHGPKGKRLFYELSVPAPGASALAVAPYRTGAPGRPTVSDLVVAEAKRRLKDGRPGCTLKDFARELALWVAANHPPPAPQVTAKRLETVVREVFWAAVPKAPK